MSPARIYSGLSAEQRHEQRRSRLIDAAIELMGTRGVSATTVTAVCAQSRVTSRYFYQHFEDRNALLRAVYENVFTTLRTVIVEAIPNADAAPAELAYAPLRQLLHVFDSDPRLGRIVFVESGAEPLLRQLRSDLISNFTDLVVKEARLRLDIPDAALGVAHLASTLGVGGLFEVLRRWFDNELDYTAEELVTHCAGFLGSLGAYVLDQHTK